MTHDILMVDDDPGTIQIMARILAGMGHLRFATNGQDALRLMHEATPDLVLLDAEMPGMSGFQLCQALKADLVFADVPVIFVSSHHEAAFELNGFEVGAADFIAKPVSAPLVQARVRTQLRMKQMADQLRRHATIDGLTGVANRRRFDDALLCEWLRARRTPGPIALLLVDVDHFKLYNDCHGHPAGDAALQAVAQALGQACLRPADLVARYGGEEFALLLPLTAPAGAQHMAQRVLDAVAALALPHAASPGAGLLAVSVGLACVGLAGGSVLRPGEDPSPAHAVAHSAADLVQAADRALYAAKHAGRNQAWRLDVGSAAAVCCAAAPAACRLPEPA